MRFVTLFTRLKNVNLTKDVGMIPYLLSRDYGFESTVVCHRNEASYDYLDREVKGLGIEFIKGSGAWYVIKNARCIDVLNLYHLNLQTFFLSLIYRLLKKKGGKLYLKLDMDLAGYDRLVAPGPVGMIKRATMDLVDIISVETETIYEKLKDRYGNRLLWLPNGYYTEEIGPEKDLQKEKMILTVGNLGTEAKATDVLADAFVMAAGQRKDWTLHLAGPVNSNYVNRYEEDPRIVFEGEIRDREKLRQLYRRAAVFAFPSRHESFGIVMLEAASCGECIISTEGVPAARDIIGVTGFGSVVPVDDRKALAEEFRRYMGADTADGEPGMTDFDWNARAEDVARRTFEHYRWESLIGPLAERLRG